MAGATRTILVKFTGDSKQLSSATKQADQATSGFGVNLGKLAASAGYAKLAAEAVSFGKESVKAAQDDRNAQIQLKLAIQQATGASDEQVAAIENAIAKMEAQTGTMDDELRPAYDTLVRATRDTGTAMQLLGIANDVAVGKGKDLASVTDALAKAYQGNTKGLRDLGIQLKNADGSAKSFKQISDELVQLYGGAAKTAFDSDPAKQLNVQLQNLKETVGNALLPVIKTLSGVAEEVLGWFNKLSPATQQVVVMVGLLGGGMLAAVKSVSSLKQAFGALGVSATTAGAAMAGVGIIIAAATLVYQDNAAWKAKVKQVTDDFVSALQAEANGQRDAVNAAIAAKIAQSDLYDTHVDLIDVGQKLGLTAQDIADVISGKSVPAFDRLTKVYGELHGAWASTLAPDLQAQEHGFKVSGQSAADFHFVITQLQEAFGQAQQKVDLLALANKALGVTTADGTTPSLKDQTQALKDLKQALDEAEQAARSRLDGARAEIDAQFASNQAIAQYVQGAKDMAEAHKKGKKGSEDYAAALEAEKQNALGVADANVRLAEEQAAANGTTLTAAQRQKILIDSLSFLANSLDPSSPLRAALEGYIAQLGAVPTDISTSITTDTSEVHDALDGLVNDTSTPITQKVEADADTTDATKKVDQITAKVNAIPDIQITAYSITGIATVMGQLDLIYRKLLAVRDMANSANRAVANVAD